MKKILLFILTISAFLLTSCISQKEIAYFKGLDADSASEINQHFQPKKETTICNGDVLLITISGLDPQAVAPFNLPLVMYTSPGSDKINSTPTIQTHLVDVNGNINFPVLGTLKLSGLTKSAAIGLIKEKLSPYLKDPIINIDFMNYEITVLGEVSRPGKYTINNERITVLDALGLAGDLTIFGKRNNILITRENDGKLEFVRLNLNSKDIFNSPYFYLKQNDIIYIEPNKAKAITYQDIPLYYLATISTISVITTAFIYYNK